MTKDEPLNLRTEIPLRVASKEMREEMAVRRMEWGRIIERLEKLPESGSSSAYGLGFTFLGGAIGTGVATIIVKKSIVDVDPNLVPMLWLITGALSVVTAVCFYFGWQLKRHRRGVIEDICNEMRIIEAGSEPAHVPADQPTDEAK